MSFIQHPFNFVYSKNYVYRPSASYKAIRSDGIRTSSSESQIGWVIHILKNLLTRSIVILTMLHVDMVRVVIDVLFTGLSSCLRQDV